MPILTAASMMCMNILDLRSQIDLLNNRIDYFHVDLMDGHYAPNITLSPDFVKACAPVLRKPIEVHLMVEKPDQFIEPLAMAGVSILSPHAEVINAHAFRTFNQIERLGCKPGIVINPATPMKDISMYLDRLHMITLMTVDIGYAGQPFIPQVLRKIEQARNEKEKNGYRYLIQIDGACNRATYQDLMSAGAEVLVMGSTGLFGLDPDLSVAWDKMTVELAEAMSKVGMA